MAYVHYNLLIKYFTFCIIFHFIRTDCKPILVSQKIDQTVEIKTYQLMALAPLCLGNIDG